MLDILKFIFSSFWVFIGTVILIFDTGIAISMIISAINKATVVTSLFGKVYFHSPINTKCPMKNNKNDEVETK